MEHWFFNDIIAFFVSIFFAGIIIPQILNLAFKKQLFDKVDERKIHQGVVPRLGGLAFFPTILFSVSIVVGFNLKYYGWDIDHEGINTCMSLIFLICAVLIMYMIGIADDILGVRYQVKFIFQLLAAVLIVISGDYIDDFFGFLWIHNLYDWIGWIITGFMVLYIVNAINLIDGIDGLASGLSVVAFVFYAIIFYNGGEMMYSLVACAAAGTLLPFFYYNVFGKTQNHKKIFMGDTGSLTIGIILAFCSIGNLYLGGSEIAQVYNPVILGLSPLIIPLFDVVRVFINRISRHKNPFKPDKTHIHHRLLEMNLSQRVVLSVIVVWSMFYIIINMLLSHYINPTYIIVIDIAIWIIVNVVISHYISRIKKLKISSNA